MISVDAYLTRILSAVTTVESSTVALADAHGRTLRAPVHAAVDLPVFDNSAMDGFAVRFVDVSHASPATPAVLRVIADLPAGTALTPVLGIGEAARIMTGAPVPVSADAIVPFEDTAGGLEDSLDVVRVLRPPRAAGAHIRRRGEDCAAGTVLVPAGVRLGPLQVAAIAAGNCDRVDVSRRPRVAVISTGSELVPPGSALSHGQIPESNALLLSALATETAAEVVLRGTVGDVDDDLRAALAEATARGADAVITSGGVSAGAFEVVKTTIAEMTFQKVAMQPGKPQGFAAGPPLLFGLPGNPVSAAVSFEAFVRPALLAMQGRADLHRRMLRLPAAQGWRVPQGRRQYLPVVLVDGGVAPATAGGSHLAGGLAGAEAYAVIPADVDTVSHGDLVDVMLVS
ncbi:MULTISPECIES: gephyrin-like molybdotransferase Glp [unclassified Microbacterium]|uniref:molybdopterin molybdotransferase MoeA n=1 Tax=unclassified Microbacterium TaxID=2609290 RepID=UPI00214CB5BD|nr:MULTISPECIES: gephyrin-like molybdotransferase Glp [unclassified Microbacterium]MCR2810334.1 molybdopterin molybdotransferase MoeA [Microbacterium sp. zg.B185]WIM18393.1 molybdopterin molybdotransferase MoeA [Microbacterium sp. zg-B185]